MFDYIRNKIRKHRQRRTFKEYGFTVEAFDLEDTGAIEYAQWDHPFDKRKVITEATVNFYRQFAGEGAFAIDIGAHTGDTTVPMALAVGKKGKVLGIEPNPYVYKILQKNASLNPDKTNIRTACFAVTDHEGSFTFQYSDASFCNGGYLSQIERKRHGHPYELEVKGKNLENYLQKNHPGDMERLELIKIDAEGYDKEIIKSINELLIKTKPILLVECYKRLNTEERADLFNSITSLGYDLFRFDEFTDEMETTPLTIDRMTDWDHFEMVAKPKSTT